MNGIIKRTLQHPSFPKIFFLCAVAILIATLVKVFVWIPPQFGSSIRSWVAKEFIAPVAAGGIIVGHGISDFQGTPISEIPLQTFGTTFLSLLLLFVIGPVAFLSMRKKLKEMKSEGKPYTMSFRIGYLTLFLWMFIVPAYFVASLNGSYSVSKLMREDNSVSQYREDVVNKLSAIRYAAQLYYLLPTSQGGGGKTFLKNHERILLSDLGFQETTPLGRFLLYYQRSDTILYLHFIGKRIGTMGTDYDPAVTNVVEYKVEIMPSTYANKALH